MGASFRNTGQIEALSGCDRLTISPDLLEVLSNDKGHLPKILDSTTRSNLTKYTSNEINFRWDMNEDAMATEKLAEGIRNFAADQIKLESLIHSLSK